MLFIYIPETTEESSFYRDFGIPLYNFSYCIPGTLLIPLSMWSSDTVIDDGLKV